MDAKERFFPLSSKHANLIVVGALIMSILAYIGYNLLRISDLLGPRGIGLPSEMVRYVSRTGHFSMLMPRGWYAADLSSGNHGDPESKMVADNPLFTAIYIEVFHREFPNGTISSVRDWGNQKLNAQGGFKEIALRQLSIADRQTYVLEYLRPVYAMPTKLFWASGSYRCFNWYVLDGSSGYDFSFCSVERFWPEAAAVFTEMIGSVTFSQ